MLTTQGQVRVVGRVVQVLVDGAASFGGFYIASLGEGEGGANLLLGLLGNFLGLYYFIQVMLELSIVGAVSHLAPRTMPDLPDARSLSLRRFGPLPSIGHLPLSSLLQSKRLRDRARGCPSLTRLTRRDTPPDSFIASDGFRPLISTHPNSTQRRSIPIRLPLLWTKYPWS